MLRRLAVTSAAFSENPVLVAELRERMQHAAHEERFEEAARLRNQITAVERMLERQQIVGERLVDRDVFSLARLGDYAPGLMSTRFVDEVQARQIQEVDGGRDGLLGFEDVGQDGQAFVRHGDNRLVGQMGGSGCGVDVALGDGREDGTLAGLSQTNQGYLHGPMPPYGESLRS